MSRILSLLFLIFSIVSFSTESFSVQSSIIAKVENRIISSYDLKHKVKTILFLSNQKFNQSNIDTIKRPALRSLIDLKLKEEELVNLSLPIENNKDVNNYLTGIASNFNTNLSGLKELFESNAIDFEKYNKEIQIEFAWQKLIYKIYGKNINLNNNEIDKELNKKSKKYC